MTRYPDSDRQLEKVITHARRYSMGADKLTIGFNSTLGVWDTVSSIPRVKGDGVPQHLDWLKVELPENVFARIAWMQPYSDRAKRCKRKLEIGFWDDKHPTVVIKRRGFRCAATISLICLMAP